MKLCYGYEIAGNGRDEINIYKTLERAREEAEKQVEKLADDETMILFSAAADENGKLASNLFNILDSWRKSGSSH